MADSYVFTKSEKAVRGKVQEGKGGGVPDLPKTLKDVSIMESIDVRDHYDVLIGDGDWYDALTPQQTILFLKRIRQQWMQSINAIQKEIDRISLLEMDINDPRANTDWPRYYELKVRKQNGKR